MPDFSWLAYGITHGYIASSGCSDCPHYADDIGTPFHTQVTALFSGVVVSQKTGLAWGTEIFIMPDDRSLPEYYYYHLDILETRTGEHVTAGQVIGLSGGQNSGGSNPTTPEFSSGPHTHVGFFTHWVLTPIGVRPYGPDITPYIQQLVSGQNLNAGNTSGGPAPLNGLAGLGEYVVQAFGVPSFVIAAAAGISQSPFQVIGIASLGIGAALLLAVWMMFNGL